jgi:DNA mismatch repair ATPase MutS
MLRRTAALVASGALALGGAAVLVPTSASAQQDVASATAAANKVKPAERQELRKSGHVKITRQTKKHGTVTVLVQRGVVTAVTPTAISLKSKDGYSHSYVITAKTKVREKGAAVPLSDVKVGERAMVVALVTKQGDMARRISCLRQAAAATA